MQCFRPWFDKVLLLTKFPELKFDHRFGYPFDIQACMPNFVMFQAMLFFLEKLSNFHDV